MSAGAHNTSSDGINSLCRRVDLDLDTHCCNVVVGIGNVYKAVDSIRLTGQVVQAFLVHYRENIVEDSPERGTERRALWGGFMQVLPAQFRQFSAQSIFNSGFPLEIRCDNTLQSEVAIFRKGLPNALPNKLMIYALAANILCHDNRYNHFSLFPQLLVPGSGVLHIF